MRGLDLQLVISWLRRLARLDARVFEDVRSNPGATLPGALIVLLATLIAGLGGWLWWMLRDFGNAGDIFLHSVIIGSLIAVALWGLAWLGVVYVMLTQIYRERAYVEQLLRVMGLATAPLALMGLMFIPGISMAVGLAALALTFATTTVAIQYVTTADLGRVLMSNLAGFFVWTSVLTLLASGDISTTQPNAPGVFLFNATTSITADALDLGRQVDDLTE